MAALPTELFHHIAEHLAGAPYAIQPVSRIALFNLRLTSRDVCSAVESTFLRTFFRGRSLLFTTRDLRILVKITALPKLRKQLRYLGVHVPLPQLWDLERLPFGLFSDLGPLSLHNGLIIAYRLHMDKIHDECMSLLVTALQNLVEAGIRPRMHYLPFDGDDYDIHGKAHMMRSVMSLGNGVELRDGWHGVGHSNDSAEIGLIAMTRAGFKPRDLTLGDPYYMSAPIKPQAFRLWSSLTQQWVQSEDEMLAAANAWSELESLAMCINAQHFSRGPKPLAPYMQAATLLKRLEITFSGSSETDGQLRRRDCKRFNSGLSNAHLEHLQLENVTLTEKASYILMAQHAPTLQSLSLQRARLSKKAGRARIFRWMAKTLRLRCLELSDRDRASSFGEHTICAFDEEQVQAELEKAAERIESGSSAT